MTIQLRSESLRFASTVFVFAALAACGDDAGGSGGAGAGGNSSSSTQTGTSPLEPIVVDGVSIPRDLELCAESMTPNVGPNDVSFEWMPVTSANLYAVRAYRTDGEFVEITDDLLVHEGLQETTTYSFGERTSGISYRLDVYAIEDTTALCVLGGFNMVGPL
jgi:hypothetical protein